MLKIIPNRVVKAINPKNKAPFKGGVSTALQQTVQPIVNNIPAQTFSNGPVVKFLSSMVVSVIKSCRRKFAPTVQKNFASTLQKQGENGSNKGIELSQNIGSSLKGFADITTKQTEGLSNKIKKFSQKTRNVVSDFKEFCRKEFSELKPVNDAASKNAKTEVSAEKTEKTNIFDRMLERKKRYTKKPHSESSNGNVNDEVPRYKSAKTEAPKNETKKADALKESFENTKIKRENVCYTKTEPKAVKNEKSFANGTKAEKLQKYSNPVNAEKSTPVSENPFRKIKQPEAQKTPLVPYSDVNKGVNKGADDVRNGLKPKSYGSSKAKEPAFVTPSTPTAKKLSVKNVKTLKNDISTLETKIFVGNALGQDTKALKKELATKKKALAAIVKSSNKKNTKGVNGVKTKPQKKFRRLSNKNYIGKSFGAITGKGGLLSKQQYTPDGKLLRTIYNRGNGLIEVREAATNKTYFVRNGKKIEKSLIEQQNDSMKRLINIMGSANGSTEIKGLANSYAEKCGMERVSQTVMLDGKLTKIVYKGFGYDITADGRVLSKNYTAGGQVFHTDLTGKPKQSKKTGVN